MAATQRQPLGPPPKVLDSVESVLAPEQLGLYEMPRKLMLLVLGVST